MVNQPGILSSSVVIWRKLLGTEVRRVRAHNFKDRVKVAKVRSNFLYDEMGEDNDV
jgi:hypothetical protein